PEARPMIHLVVNDLLRRRTGQGDKETGRQGDKETGRQGDKETRRPGDKSSPRRSLLVSLSPCLASGRELQRLGLADAGREEALEELQVQRRGGLRLGVPLDADAEPVGVGRLDGLDNAVGGEGGDAQAGAGLADRLVVSAVDADLAAAVDLV